MSADEKEAGSQTLEFHCAVRLKCRRGVSERSFTALYRTKDAYCVDACLGYGFAMATEIEEDGFRVTDSTFDEVVFMAQKGGTVVEIDPVFVAFGAFPRNVWLYVTPDVYEADKAASWFEARREAELDADEELGEPVLVDYERFKHTGDDFLVIVV